MILRKLYFFVGCCFFSMMACAETISQKPFTIPEMQQWTAKKGSLTLNKSLNIVANDKVSVKVANQLADDFEALFGLRPTISSAKATNGDVVLCIKKQKKSNNEAYSLTIDKNVTLTSATETGLFYATRSLLQMCNHSLTLPCGSAIDKPSYALRGFLIDCGRKYIPIDYLRNLVKIMGYYKMNTLQVHLNDNGFRAFFDNDFKQTYAAFRLECETFPELTARDGFYTKKEFIDLQNLAESVGVEIIPEIDVPAHSLAFAHLNPELGSKEYGADHLDLFNPETYRVLDALFAEYLKGPNPVFIGKRVHIGTDEYSNKDTTVVEKFRYFTDRYIKYVESFGKQACVWGALTHAKGKTPVKADNVLMNCWYNGYANPKEMKKLGYKLVSVPDGLLYIVPAAGYYFDYLDIKNIYNNWTPAKIGNQTFSDDDPSIEGGMFAEWNDRVGNGISVKDIHHRVFPAMQTLAAKLWTAKGVTVPFDSFDVKRKQLVEAPGVNELGRHHLKKNEILVLQQQLKPNQTLPYDGVGYNYVVSFDIKANKETLGTELLRSNSSVLYLSDPVTGMMSFARDGYTYNFSYRFLPGETAKVRIEGTNTATKLYVNDRLIDNLGIHVYYADNKGEHKMNVVRTLYFPLNKTGKFNSEISNFKVIEL